MPNPTFEMATQNRIPSPDADKLANAPACRRNGKPAQPFYAASVLAEDNGGKYGVWTMTNFSTPIPARLRHGLTLAAGIATLILISGPAVAAASVENVHVISPRPVTVYDEFDLPILDVTLSKPVSYRNLNLLTHHGAHTLRFRIRNTARELCARLSFQYPITTSGGPQCYRTAVNDALHSADNAIREARYNAGIHTVRID